MQTKRLTAETKLVFGLSVKTPNVPFETLLNQNGSFSRNVRNLQKVMTEVSKPINRLTPLLAWELCERKHVSYNLRVQNRSKLLRRKTGLSGDDHCGLEGFSSKMSQHLEFSERGGGDASDNGDGGSHRDGEGDCDGGHGDD